MIVDGDYNDPEYKNGIVTPYGAQRKLLQKDKTIKHLVTTHCSQGAEFQAGGIDIGEKRA